MKTARASLRFLGYHVDKMVFFSKTNFTTSEMPIELAPMFKRNIVQTGEKEHKVTIGVRLDQENLPFNAELEITGRFEYDGELDVDKLLKINAVSIMYPYVRATLSMMTTIAGIPPVIIPTINLAQMFERNEQKN